MTISPMAVRFDGHTMWVDLSDGRTLGVPLAWFPRLLRATPAQREGVELSRLGLHWDELNEDISIAGLLAGRGDMTIRSGRVAIVGRNSAEYSANARRAAQYAGAIAPIYSPRALFAALCA
jgi:hypothetical protein